jgi:hypothetical protein
MPKFSFVVRRDSCYVQCDIVGRGGTFRCNLNGEVYALPHTMECLTMFFRLERFESLPDYERNELGAFLQSLLP